MSAGRDAKDRSDDAVSLDEATLVESLVLRDGRVSRNRHYDLLSTEIGRRARRRAAFLRSLASELERAKRDRGVVELERGAFSRGPVRLTVHVGASFVRSAYVTDEELALLRRASSLAARVLDVASQKPRDE